jgi:hypothetical protein
MNNVLRKAFLPQIVAGPVGVFQHIVQQAHDPFVVVAASFGHAHDVTEIRRPVAVLLVFVGFSGNKKCFV